MGILKGEEKEQGLESIFRQIVDENFPNLRNELELGIQEVNRTSNYLNPKSLLSRHIVLKLSKIKHKESSEKSKKRRRQPIKENPLDYRQTSQHKPYKPERSGIQYSNY